VDCSLETLVARSNSHFDVPWFESRTIQVLSRGSVFKSRPLATVRGAKGLGRAAVARYDI
jgi:hypothetical protein